ncbi:MAG: hypothetical protein WC621_04490 [Patescibacteria group bacterium]
MKRLFGMLFVFILVATMLSPPTTNLLSSNQKASSIIVLNGAGNADQQFQNLDAMSSSGAKNVNAWNNNATDNATINPVTADLIATTDAVQVLNGNLTNSSNNTVENFILVSSNSAEYVMAWITSNSLMVNMANYNNGATNSWNSKVNNISAHNNNNLDANVGTVQNYQLNYNLAAYNTEAWNNSNDNTGKSTNTATLKNTYFNSLNSTLNFVADNSSSGLTSANYAYKTQSINYRV